jgi:hypothetical protein
MHRRELLLVSLLLVALQAAGLSQGLGRGGDDTSITYTRGQSVVPIFHGWMRNTDGTVDLYFSYINRNWQEEVDLPIGPNNNISSPFGPDAGQPTHFYPRVNRWVFSVRVPSDFGSKEIVWTLTSHDQTHRAYASLNPGYEIDDFLIMHEFGNSVRGRKWPIVNVEGEKRRTAKVGQPVQLIAVGTDPNPQVERPRGADLRAGDDQGRAARSSAEIRPGSVGGDFVRGTARGLYLGWLVIRGPSGTVTFDPPIPFKMWEDQRGGSPWAPGWRPPPVPPGNKWVHNVTFREPGTYVIRAQVRDGYLFANEDLTFTVTR